jgi:phosphatidylserine/phosphatidylglycerophosphate/cardiolipin synthase-like enzyme
MPVTAWGADNLNLSHIRNADGPDVHFSTVRPPEIRVAASVEVHFQDLERLLIREIKAAQAVVGCMAWLTNERILYALAKKEEVAIVVNKEDFLRPDKGGWSQEKIRQLYASLKGSDRYTTGLFYSSGGDPTLEAIRCAGIHKDRRDIPPRMHHKFLVFCRIAKFETKQDESDWRITTSKKEVDDYPEDWMCRPFPKHTHYSTEYVPQAVWTGSFNATENGTRSLENAVIIRDAAIASAYYQEWTNIQGISEPLDWTSTYVEPEWRIGT